MKISNIYIVCLFIFLGVDIVFAVPAFPGAEGFGADSIGGRGGVVYEVTNLDDNGPGSLRAAVEASGPRTVVFCVSGTIELQSNLTINNPYITIAGQTAPGDGICLKNFGLRVMADHVIIRYIRCRLGDDMLYESDSIWVGSGHDIILDHCSASWSVDETLSVTTSSVGNVTIQWCMITESLNCSIHEKGCHGYGSLIGGSWGNGYSFHHNLYAHHRGRSPRPGNPIDYVSDPCGLIFDFRNNVVYNWGGSYAGYNADGQNGLNSVTKMNFVSNYYKRGTNSTGNSAFSETTKTSKAYFSNNWMEGVNPSDPWSLVIFSGSWSQAEKDAYKQSSPIPAAPITTLPTPIAYSRVLAEAGASFPVRDAVDARIIDNVVNRTGGIIACVDGGNFYFPTGVAQAATSNTITLAADASTYDSCYSGWQIEILSGTGAGQIRAVSSYSGVTKIATVSANWTVIPDATSMYGRIVNCSHNAGGYPVLACGSPPIDSDHDGMPDEWEVFYGLNPYNANDRNDDRNGDEYTNLEEYLNWLPLGQTLQPHTDINSDGIVNGEDFSEFANHWQSSLGDIFYSANCDFDYDDKISISDLFYLIQDWLSVGQGY